MQSENPEREDRLQLSYCYGGTVQYEPGEILGPRMLTDYEAVLILAGSPHYETAAGFQALAPGSILIARPGTRETYHWDPTGRTRHAYLHFNMEKIPADWPATATWPQRIISPPSILGQLFRHLLERTRQHPEWPSRNPDSLENHLFETFLELYFQFEQENGAIPPGILSEPVRRATKFMRERLDRPRVEPFTLAELAATAHVSAKHLCRVFTDELGVSPMKACRLMQFQLAIPLLARSNMSIKEVAERCGFADQLYFSRSFSRNFGHAPSKIRNAMREGQRPPVTPLPPALMPRLHW